MAPPPDDDHECGWRVFAKDLAEKMTVMEAKMAAMERRIHEQAGQNLADLHSLVATCTANDKDPLAYLTDVLGRIGSHPAAQLDDLLPQNWSPPA